MQSNTVCASAPTVSTIQRGTKACCSTPAILCERDPCLRQCRAMHRRQVNRGEEHAKEEDWVRHVDVHPRDTQAGWPPEVTRCPSLNATVARRTVRAIVVFFGKHQCEVSEHYFLCIHNLMLSFPNLLFPYQTPSNGTETTLRSPPFVDQRPNCPCAGTWCASLPPHKPSAE